MYSNKIMEEFLNPKNYGVIRGASAVGKVSSDEGGEIIKIYISVENGRISEAQFQTFGGVVAIALTSFATAYLTSKTLSEAERITPSDILRLSGPVPENKNYIATLVVSAIRKAVSNFNNKNSSDD